MNNLMMFESFLDSNFAPLYHWTNKVAPILFSDTLKAQLNTRDVFDFAGDYVQHKSISFSRDKLFYHTLTGEMKLFRLVLDGNKLRQKYKLIPYDAFGSYAKHDPLINTGKVNTIYRTSNSVAGGGDERLPVEFEEVILNRNVSNLHEYVQAIEVSKHHHITKAQARVIERYCSTFPDVRLHLIDAENLHHKPERITPNLIPTL